MGRALPKGMTGADSPAFSIGKRTVLASLRKTAIAFYHITLRELFSKVQGLIGHGKTSRAAHTVCNGSLLL